MIFGLFMAILTTDPTPSPAAPRVAEGRWGGTSVAIEVTSAGARIEFDCAHGSIDGPLELDADGRFDLPGTFARERPGPVRMGQPEEKGAAVRYVGRLEGETLTLRIVWPNAAKPSSSFTAELGRTPRLHKCG